MPREPGHFLYHFASNEGHCGVDRRVMCIDYANRDALLRLKESSSDTAYQQRHRQLVMTVVERFPMPAKDGVQILGIVGDVDAVVSFFPNS